MLHFHVLEVIVNAVMEPAARGLEKLLFLKL